MRSKTIHIINGDIGTVEVLKRQLRGRYRLRELAAADLSKNLVRKGTFLLAHLNETSLPLINQIKTAFPDVPVICQANAPRNECVLEAFRHGAADFIAGSLSAGLLSDSLLRISGRKPKSQSGVFQLVLVWEHLQLFWEKLTKVLRPRKSKKEKITDLAGPIEMQPIYRGGFSIPSQFMLTAGNSASSLPYSTLNEDPDLAGYFMGHFRLEIRGRPHKKLPARKSKSILAYLLHHHHRRIPREVLMEIILARDFAQKCPK